MYKNRRRRTCEFALENVCCDIHQGEAEVQIQIESVAVETEMPCSTS